MITICKLALVVGILITVMACGADPQRTDEPRVEADRLLLPAALIEVSGLAGSDTEVLYAVGDEVGQIYAIDFDAAHVTPSISIGSPTVRADFEGLSLHGEHLFALTSKGVLYRVLHQGASELQKIKTGLSKQCEFEGIAADRDEPILWLLCKKPLKKRLKGKLTLFAWHRIENQLLDDRTLSLPYAALGLSKNLSPSGISMTEDGQSFLIVAAKQRAFVYLSKSGELEHAGNLPNRQAHAQAEGVLVHAGSIYVADEGGQGPGQITRYAHGF